MNQQVTKAIVLSRTNYGEADRIVTLLTPDHGKLRVMARGVRKVKSKLAGGIELFSVSDITYIQGRGDMQTLVSARLEKHYANIAKHLDRVQLGYELIKQINKATEDQPEPEYFALLEQSLGALDDAAIPLELIQMWFQAQLLRLGGFEPNLITDEQGNRLVPDQVYMFNPDDMGFAAHPRGLCGADHIKILRLLFGQYEPGSLMKVQGVVARLGDLVPLVRAMYVSHIG